MREIVLDTETTGLDPNQGHRLVEVGCVELLNRIPTGLTFHAYVNPERDMPFEAFNVHGLSAEFLSQHKRFHEIVDEFMAFIGDDTPLVIHNAEFDHKFLCAELKLVKRGLITRSASEADRRRVLIRITAAGRRFVQKMLPPMFPRIGTMFEGFSATDKRHLDRLLRKLAGNLDRLSEDTHP